ncbi:MAG: hypothetical protein NTX25_13110 [Proteobacteria bacterium]|nr:hypothetical protein [Pseudomonadota bacterium]
MDLRSFLREKITAWSEASKRHTLLYLAERSRLGYSTVRRLASGEGDANLQSLLQLASVILSPEETRQTLQDYFPEARLGLERPFRFFPNEKNNPISSKEALLAVALSCPDDGIEQAELEAIIGTRSFRCIQSLVDAEILCRQDTKLKLASDYFFDPNPERILRWMGYILELFDCERADKVGNFTSLRIEGLNDRGIQKLHEVMTEAESAIQEILNDKNCRGVQSVATALVSAVLNPQAPSP